jgi:hypothetical protein
MPSALAAFSAIGNRKRRGTGSAPDFFYEAVFLAMAAQVMT